MNLTQHKGFNRTALVLWGLWAAAFLVLEGVGLYNLNDGWPPLTQVVVAYVPYATAMGFIAWLRSHFTQSYEQD